MIRKRIFFILLLLVSFIGVYIILDYYTRMKLVNELKKEQASDIVLGNRNAKHNIIVYFDYNCAFCRKFLTETTKQLGIEYGEDENIKITLRLVCRKSDQQASMAYQTAICLSQFGDYMKLHKLLMYQPQIIYTEHFSALVEDYIATNEMLGECIVDSNQDDVKRNIYQFQELEAVGTPFFIIGDEVINGLSSAEELKKIIKSEFK